LAQAETEEERERRLMVDYAMCFVGTWYSWGGDDPAGFDCSHFVWEVLKAIGRDPSKDDSTWAQRLFNQFQNNTFIKTPEAIADSPRAGYLMFCRQKSDGKIFHVELCVDEKRTVGASGGGSKTVTKEDAIRDNAFIKMRPIEGRWNRAKVELVFVDPWKAA